jgi:hypothetical protein
LLAGVDVSGTDITNNLWIMYSIQVSNTSSLMVQLKETSGTGGFVWLFVNADSYPTLSDYDGKAIETNSALHRVTLPVTYPNSRTYYIGIYGSPMMLANARINYRLVAWYPTWS